MILLISCFVTHQRPLNKHNRLDVFMSTLKTYSRIKWDEVYLFIRLDEEFIIRRDELYSFLSVLYNGTKVRVFTERLESQGDWVPVIEEITRKTDLVWFSQNDDHPFIDVDNVLLDEGVAHLRQDTRPLKSLYYSHWTEMIKLSGKLRNWKRKGNYIVFEATLIDAVQIFSSDLMRRVFIDTDWEGKRYARIDTLLRQKSIWGDKNGNTDVSLQNVYVPLRELCRKFAGYSHVGMEYVNGLEFKYDLVLPDRSPDAVRQTMLASHSSMWTENNDFSIPEEWIRESQRLYRLGKVPDAVGSRTDGQSACAE